VAKGNRELVELLVTRGADLNARDNDGQSPLFTAVYGRRLDLVEFLVNNGALVDCVDRYVVFIVIVIPLCFMPSD
jgi:cytohesin